MIVRLGVGPYESARMDRPSTHEARLIFLRLLDSFKYHPHSETTFKNDVPASLHDRVFFHFAALVAWHFEDILFSETPLSSFSSDSALILHIRDKVSPEKVEEFLPDHRTLESVSTEAHERLLSWAEVWSINSDWCLDFAVEAMRLWLFDRRAREFKLWEPALRRDSSSFIWSAVAEHVIEESFHGAFSFEYENVHFSSASWNYRIEEDAEWKQTVTGKFLEHLKSILDSGEMLPGSSLSRVASRFDKEVEKHIREATAEINKRGYKRTPQVRDYAPFVWTICYQVLRFTLSQASREFKKPQKTLADGIDGTLALIGLKKRAGSRRGRKPMIIRSTKSHSVREEVKRRSRLDQFVKALAVVSNPENKTAVARAIGISSSHFRRAWVPYLMKVTGSVDYASLVRKYWERRLKLTTQ